MRTIILGTTDKPIIVFIHGYASAGPLFYRILQPLQEHFRIILVDIIGMGGSSRPNDFLQSEFSPDETTNYFINYFEKWRKAMRLTDFVLVGHSFGGYIAGLYTEKYSQHIKKLVLLSPIGLRIPEKGEVKNWGDRFDQSQDRNQKKG